MHVAAKLVSLEDLMEMAYVKDKLSPEQKDKLIKSYEKAPEAMRADLAEKLQRMNQMYLEYSMEENPQKQTLILFKMMKEQLQGVKQKIKGKKKEAMLKIEEKEQSKALAGLEAQLGAI